MKRKLITFATVLLSALFLFAGCSDPAGNGGEGGSGGGSGNGWSWNSDATQHWEERASDGAKKNFGEHVDADNDNKCDTCQRQLSGGGGGEEIQNVTVTIYYKRSKGYDKCDAWLWDDLGAIRAGGYLWDTGNYENGYGAKVSVDLTTASGRLGLLIRTDCSDPGGDSWGTANKDGTGDDRFVPLDPRFIRNGTITIYIHEDDKNIYIKNDSGEEEVMKLFDMADMTSLTRINCIMTPAPGELTPLHPRVTDSKGQEVKYSSIRGTALSFSSPLDFNEAYTVSLDGYGSAPVVPYTYFNTAAFTNNYNYEGDDLGVTFNGGVPSFRLWAPTASKVTLNIYEAGSGDNLIESVDLARAEKGTWTATGKASYVNKYYTYTVTTSLGANEAVDPYAVSGGINGDRGMILDLTDPSTFPTGWSADKFTAKMANGEDVVNFTDANIWEIHIRDFSNQLDASNYKGKYLAFTETGLKTSDNIPLGIDYLKELGITHVHVQPAFDYSSVDETKTDGFNWGYDPKNYNMPEGSYSTDATRGEVRVKEFRAMVQALHDAGIGVIMDVVYNHTSGLNSNLQKIVPYYYYRYNTSTGKPANGSGCGNETASDRFMFGKFMLDSVKHWLNDYNVDGFRFDLMGLHDVATMKKIEQAVHEINPKAILYGEGWDGGSNAIKQPNLPANLNNLSSVAGTKVNGIAMFNNTTRDAAKGGTNDASAGFVTGNTSAQNRNRVLFAYTGGTSTTYRDYWNSANPTQVINYLSCHDNLAFFDKIQLTKAARDRQLQYNRLGAALIQTSLGVPFMLAGEEMLRSKPNNKSNLGFDENSYSSSDEVNNLKWSRLTANSEEYQMMQYYKGLIAFRAAHPVLRSTDAGVFKSAGESGALITVRLTKGSDSVFIVLNAGAATSVTLPSGTWYNYVNGTTAGTTKLGGAATGSQSIAAYSCYVFANN